MLSSGEPPWPAHLEGYAIRRLFFDSVTGGRFASAREPRIATDGRIIFAVALGSRKRATMSCSRDGTPTPTTIRQALWHRALDTEKVGNVLLQQGDPHHVGHRGGRISHDFGSAVAVGCRGVGPQDDQAKMLVFGHMGLMARSAMIG